MVVEWDEKICTCFQWLMRGVRSTHCYTTNHWGYVLDLKFLHNFAALGVTRSSLFCHIPTALTPLCRDCVFIIQQRPCDQKTTHHPFQCLRQETEWSSSTTQPWIKRLLLSLSVYATWVRVAISILFNHCSHVSGGHFPAISICGRKSSGHYTLIMFVMLHSSMRALSR